MSLYISSNNATHSRLFSLSSLAPIKFIVLTSVQQASKLQTFCKQRFFRNNTVETTGRSRYLDCPFLFCYSTYFG